MQVQHQVRLAPLTTLGLGGPARRFAEATTEEELVDALRDAEAHAERVVVLGGGSNVVIGDDGFDGFALRVVPRGIRVARDGGRIEVDVGAGEAWEPFVARCVGEGWSGVECLSGIPGLVGATPIQNVGAYGQEVSDTLAGVRVFDREARAFVDMEPEACRLGYRTSLFRRNDRYVVVRVRFALDASDLGAPLRYAELARALGAREGERVPAAGVRAAVLTLRAAKGMILDPHDPDAVSVGSFFVNPTLAGDELEALEQRVQAAGVLRSQETMPRFPAAAGRWKVSAGWLVERAGFVKGFGGGRVGVSRKHALALVHRGGGSTRELLALARTIRDGVRARFGVELSPEPVMVGCSL
jgi:UDP-N-acetylmuramate dehydrogenase